MRYSRRAPAAHHGVIAAALVIATSALAVACGGDEGRDSTSGATGEVTGCGPGTIECAGTCVDTFVDSGNCGQCGNACGPGQVCDGTGKCLLTCQFQLTDCGGVCIDTATDRNHCGACDSPCDPGEICDGAGVCALSCQAGLSDCSGTCIDPLADEDHCGAGPDCAADAGVACAPGELCDGAGSCALSCGTGFVNCSDTCIDPLTDEDHCGAGADCTANPGTACTAGDVCDGAGVCAASCQAGLVDCNGTCVDPATDEIHCGAGSDCAIDPGALCGQGEVCQAGACALTCAPPTQDCGDGFCTNTAFDPAHCGGCAIACSAQNGTPTCTGGTCVDNCNPGFADCDGDAASNGCEADIATEMNCGACGNACSAFEDCIMGSCTPVYSDWLVGTPCNGADFGGGCTPAETGYHYKGNVNGHECWWHTKNQAWNTTVATNTYGLALQFGLDPATGSNFWCQDFGTTPTPPYACCASYQAPSDIGAWGWCGGAPFQSGGWICFQAP